MAGELGPGDRYTAKRLILFINEVMCEDVRRRDQRVGEIATEAWVGSYDRTFDSLCDYAEEILRAQGIWCDPED